MTAGLRVSDDELKTLLVTQLEVMDEPEFERVRALASRFKIPFEQAVVERGGIPLRFLLEQLGKLWGVEFTELRARDATTATEAWAEEDLAPAWI